MTVIGMIVWLIVGYRAGLLRKKHWVIMGVLAFFMGVFYANRLTKAGVDLAYFQFWLAVGTGALYALAPWALAALAGVWIRRFRPAAK